MKATAMAGLSVGGAGVFTSSAVAAPGDLLGNVSLPSHSAGVGIAFDGLYVYTVRGLVSSVLQVYTPPASGNGTATLVAEKNIVDGGGNPVYISGFDWDPGRGKMWGAHRTNVSPVYLIDIGDPANAGQNAVADHQFDAASVTGAGLMDGVAYDGANDHLWLSGDVNSFVHVFAADGTDLGGFDPKEAGGGQMGLISGLAVGAQLNGRPTAFIGRNGLAKISRVYADNGEFIEDFANLPFRVEDLACDPVTYAPKEAILTKDAFDGFYVAFEVDPGTCLPGGVDCEDTEVDLIAGQHTDVGAVTVSEDGDDITVTFTVEEGWYLAETHLHVAGDCGDIPQTGSGNPQVVKFDHSESYGYGGSKQMAEYTISQSDLGLSAGDTVCIAAHAVVYTYDSTGELVVETAWGEGERFTERGNWAMHFDYDVCD